MKDIITLNCGDGGKYTNSLINEVFYKHFGNELLVSSMDAASFEMNKGRLAFTTDSFVVKPLFFQGGDIGKLAVCGTIIAIDRYKISMQGKIQSDCMPLNNIIQKLQNNFKYIKLMKDPTRGGVATALNEIAQKANRGIIISEELIPIVKEIKSINEMLGLDPLYLACEGRMIIVAEKQKSKDILEKIKCLKGCENAAIIGYFATGINNNVLMETLIGGKRIIGPLEENLLPRIC